MNDLNTDISLRYSVGKNWESSVIVQLMDSSG